MLGIQGHRGSSANYPENTLLAYRRAINEGATAFEGDVRRTRDGVFVMIHDDTVDRTTDGTGHVDQLTWAEIATLDAGKWMGSQFENRDDTRIPRLDHVLDTFRGRDIFIVLQLKLPHDDALEVADLVSRRRLLRQCILFGPLETIDAIKKRYPAALTLNDGMLGPSNYQWALDSALRHNHLAVSLNALSITQEIVDTIHTAGLYVHASYLAGDFENRVEHLIHLGVDFILGDDCAAMVAVAERMGKSQVTPSTLEKRR